LRFDRNSQYVICSDPLSGFSSNTVCRLSSQLCPKWPLARFGLSFYCIEHDRSLGFRKENYHSRFKNSLLDGYFHFFGKYFMPRHLERDDLHLCRHLPTVNCAPSYSLEKSAEMPRLIYS